MRSFSWTSLVLALGTFSGGLTACMDSPEERDLQARALVNFGDCNDLTKHARAEILRELELKYLFYSPKENFSAPPPSGLISKGEIQTLDLSSEHSTQNIQVSRVQGPERIKTDGARIVSIDDGMLRVVDVRGPKAQVTDELKLRTPNGRGGEKFFLYGNRVLVLDDRFHFDHQRDNKRSTALVFIDISTPGAARIEQEFVLEGGKISATQVDATVRLVLETAPKELGLRSPRSFLSDRRVPVPVQSAGSGGSKRQEEAKLAWKEAVLQARAHNEKALENATAQNFIPQYRRGFPENAQGTSNQPLYACSQVLRPGFGAGFQVISVLNLDLSKAPSVEPVMGLLGSSPRAYASDTSLYLANSTWTHQRDWLEARGASIDNPPEEPPLETFIYKFDVSQPTQARHLATARLKGRLARRTSMSEYKGVLRVALIRRDEQDSIRYHNSLVMLNSQDNTLEERARIDGIELGKDIMSMRYMGDFAYGVTYWSDANLRALDLRNPEQAQILGEFPAIGQRSHIHAIAPGFFLGVDFGSQPNLKEQQIKLSLYDVRDIRAPKEIHTHILNRALLRTEFEPETFLYDPGTQTVLLTIRGRRTRDENYPSTSESFLVHVDKDTGFELRSVFNHIRPNHPEAKEPRYSYFARINSAVQIQETLWSVGATGIRGTNLRTGAESDWADFTWRR